MNGYSKINLLLSRILITQHLNVMIDGINHTSMVFSWKTYNSSGTCAYQENTAVLNNSPKKLVNTTNAKYFTNGSYILNLPLIVHDLKTVILNLTKCLFLMIIHEAECK